MTLFRVTLRNGAGCILVKNIEARTARHAAYQIRKLMPSCKILGISQQAEISPQPIRMYSAVPEQPRIRQLTLPGM